MGDAATDSPLRPRFLSVRLRLTLWNVLVLALALVVTGLFLRQSVEQSLIDTTDDELLRHAQQFQRIWRMSSDHGPFGDHGFPRSHGIEGDTSRHDSEHGPQNEQGEHGHGPDANHGPDHGPGMGFGPHDESQRPNIVTVAGVGYFSHQPETVIDLDDVRESLESGGPVYRSMIWGNPATPVRVLTIPLSRHAGEERFAFQSYASLSSEVHEIHMLTRGLLAVVPLALLTAGLGAAFLTDRALRPVRAVTRAASGVGAAQDLSARLIVSGNDEFSQLALTFNGMMARLEATFRDRERAYEQQRRFVADASHELRTPLTIIKANTSLALSDPGLAPDAVETLTEIDRGVDRTNRIVQDLFLLARSDSGHLPIAHQPIDLPQLLGDVVAQVRFLSQKEAEASSVGGAPTIRLRTASALPLQVEGDAAYLERLFRNLIENAARHTPAEGHITVTAEAVDSMIEVRVSDTGEGIAPEHLPRVRERFYRVDSARARDDGGTGLGLSIADAIANRHGGSLSLESELNHGTTVRVRLPRIDRVADADR